MKQYKIGAIAMALFAFVSIGFYLNAYSGGSCQVLDLDNLPDPLPTGSCCWVVVWNYVDVALEPCTFNYECSEERTAIIDQCCEKVYCQYGSNCCAEGRDDDTDEFRMENMQCGSHPCDDILGGYCVGGTIVSLECDYPADSFCSNHLAAIELGDTCYQCGP